MNTSQRASIVLGLAVTALAFPSPSVQAQPVHWLNAADGSWLDPSRWTSGMAPSLNDDVVIDALLSDPASYYFVNGVTGQARSVRIGSTADAVMNAGTSEAPTQFDISEGLLLQGTGRFTLVGRHHRMSVGGDVRIGPEARFAHYAFSGDSVVSVAGDVFNDGALFLRGVLPPRVTNRLEVGGRLINSASGTIRQESGPFAIEAEFHNSGVMEHLNGTIGRDGADHVNTGVILRGLPTFVGSSLSNHGTVAGILAPEPEDDYLGVWQINATGVHVINSGQWLAGLTADTISLEDTSVVRLALSGGMFDPPGERITATNSVVLDGVLDLRWEYLGGGAESLVRDYLLVEASSISGGFQSVLMPPLAEGFSGTIVTSDTHVILRVVPAPGTMIFASIGLSSTCRRRRSQ